MSAHSETTTLYSPGNAFSSLEELIPVHFKDNPAPYYIAGILREAIYRGILTEGEALHQSQLAERLKVSPIPLREALRLLERDGLVDFQGRRGAVVTRLSVEEIREVYEMIIALEMTAFRTALPNVQDSEVYAMTGILDSMEDTEDRDAWREQNAMFHKALYASANRRMITDRVLRMRHQVDRYIRLHLEQMRQASEVQHRDIVSALSKHDAEAAASALENHLTQSSLILQELTEALRG